jgi:tetratricopeptide (TPR) repeat protein
MNVKSVSYWFSDNWVWALSPSCAVVAILAGVPFFSVPFLIWLALSLIWVMSCAFTPLRTYIGPTRYYYQAARLGQKGRFQECLGLITRFIRRHPRDGDGYRLRALALYGSGRHEEALAEADRAVHWKRRWQSLMIRGQILGALGCTPEALADLEGSCRLKEHPFTRMLIGQAYVSLRQLDTAVEILKRSTKSVKYSVTFMGLGDCYRFLGRAERAEAEYYTAIEIARREALWGSSSLSVAAYCLAQLSKDGEAIDAAGIALEKNDSDALALWTKALVNVRQGETDRAEVTLKQMLLISPMPVIGALVDPQFTPLLAEKRFRELLAWALGGQRQIVERVRARMQVESGDAS